ncbi:hypothetical protein [Streptomyces yaizuensis]|uniref:Uncharacterized protein n=1 Tax=Streptomyces yaizuensis TaxID=2989713 RepID=A0AA86IVD9_9ACTN|nr:hypothetical protein [Streptomyces sp. YSPA8]BDT39509.1 hypothetical protein SYYSPA8_36955 [Streptomyces sp. YSPA8]
MTVYFAFVPTGTQGRTPVRMEFAANLEVPQLLLQARARQQASHTYYDGRRPFGEQPEAEFPEADLSAFMVVWRRRASEPVPGAGEQPDEVWSLSALGAVVRERWERFTPEVFRPAPVRQRRRGTVEVAPHWRPRRKPAGTPPAEALMSTVRSVRLDRRGTAVVVQEVPRPACEACGTVPNAEALCGCS